MMQKASEAHLCHAVAGPAGEIHRVRWDAARSSGGDQEPAQLQPAQQHHQPLQLMQPAAHGEPCQLWEGQAGLPLDMSWGWGLAPRMLFSQHLSIEAAYGIYLLLAQESLL